MEHNETTASYRACFGTDAGKRVLGNILLDAGYFDSDLSLDGEIAVQNFAKKIVGKITGAPLDRNITLTKDKVDGYINGLYNLGG